MEKEVDLCPILYTLTMFSREKQIFDHTSRWNIFVTLFLPYKVLMEQWCCKNVHMETVRSTHVIVKQLVWCFILFSRRTSLEYPVWQERLSCWKGTLASDFFIIIIYFLFISCLNLKFPKMYCWTVHQAGFWNLCSFTGTRLSAPRGHARLYCPFSLGLPHAAQGQVSPHGPSSCPSDAAAELVFSIP